MSLIAGSKLVVPDRFRRGNRGQRLAASAEESGLELLELMRSRLGLRDYGASSMLDIGCGTRIPEAILGKGLAVRRYVGMDVDDKLIHFLQQHVNDDRFDFHCLNLYNKMYNPQGTQLTLDYRLPVHERFDVIGLFSVFTHFDPRDTDCMLAVLRQYIAPGGKLIFTCFVDDNVSGFDDRWPDKPLNMAAYTRALFDHLIVRNGWAVEALHAPTKSPLGYWLMQHCYVCS